MLRIFSLPRRVEELSKGLEELADKVKRIKKRDENKIEGLEKQFREMQTQMNKFAARIQVLERNKKK